MEIDYKENEISENESEDESQFQEKREVDELNKNKKTIKEILRPDLKKIIVFLILMHITPTLFLCGNFFDVVLKTIFPTTVFFLLPFAIPGFMLGGIIFGIISAILYYFLHYLFACLMIDAVYNVEIVKNNNRRIFIYLIAIAIGMIIGAMIFSLQNNL